MDKQCVMLNLGMEKESCEDSDHSISSITRLRENMLRGFVQLFGLDFVLIASP